MLRKSFLAILLCGWLAVGAQAEPIGWHQIERDFLASSRLASSAQAALPTFAQGQADQRPRTEESAEHPEFVRLPDGRIVPYGQGVICAENCVESFAEDSPRRSRLWLIVPPVIAGGIVCAVLCGGGELPPGGPTPFGTPTNPPGPTPTPTAPVPEPATLMLLGTGLALVARKTFKRA
jgi:hypothetical protein